MLSTIRLAKMPMPNPPKSIKLTYCGSCGLSIRDGVAICQNCGSRHFETHEYIRANQNNQKIAVMNHG